MTKANKFTLAALAALALLAAAPAATAQVETAPAVKVKSPKPPKAKTEKFKGTVVHANLAQITVQSEENPRIIRTFSLAPELRERMEKIIERGGYQHGDRVTIHYAAGGDTAVRIKGKPSKPR